MTKMRSAGLIKFVLFLDLILVLTVLGMSGADILNSKPIFGIKTVPPLGALILLLSAWLLRRAAKESAHEDPLEFITTRGHVVRLLAIGFVGIAFATSLRTVLIPPTFGDLGHYRGAAIEEAKALRVPNYLGQEACKGCHEVQAHDHDVGAHTRISCETCHGPGSRHSEVMTAASKDPSNAPAESGLSWNREDHVCLRCHRDLFSRPRQFPRIDKDKHFALVGVKDKDTRCRACHDPHRPFGLSKTPTSSTFHPRIRHCRECHTGKLTVSLERPGSHPVAFRCRQCHAEVAADLKKKSHASIHCSTCHVYIPESQDHGRMTKSGDNRLCGLCHRAGDFRVEGGPPTIDFVAHLEEVRDEGDPTDCVSCHWADFIHDSRENLK